jgi:DNA polymerase-3 subunit epsilon
MIKLFYDLETTGTDPRKHSIIQLGGVLEIDGKVLEVIDFKMRPHPKAIIDAGALRVNNRTEEEILAYPDLQTAQKQFTAWLSKYIDRFDKESKIHLVGYNNRGFDDVFLRAWFDLCKDTYFGSWFWPDSLDVLVLASEYLLDRRSSMESFKLNRVASEIGLVFDKEDLHDAVADATLTRDVYNIVTERTIEI